MTCSVEGCGRPECFPVVYQLLAGARRRFVVGYCELHVPEDELEDIEGAEIVGSGGDPRVLRGFVEGRPRGF